MSSKCFMKSEEAKKLGQNSKTNIKISKSTENIKTTVQPGSPENDSSKHLNSAAGHDGFQYRLASECPVSLQAELLDERKQKEAALYELKQLQENYNGLLLKYAEAKNTIDRQRFASTCSVKSSPYVLADVSLFYNAFDETLANSDVEEELCNENDDFIDESWSEIDLDPVHDKSTSPAEVGTEQEQQPEFVECAACSCPPDSRKYLNISGRTSTATWKRGTSTQRATLSISQDNPIVDKDNVRLRAKCLQDQISMTMRQDVIMDRTDTVDHLNHLRFQLQGLTNEVDSLNKTGADVESLENLVHKLDADINRCDEFNDDTDYSSNNNNDDEEDEWVSTSASVTECSSVSSNNSWSNVKRKLSNSFKCHQEFKRDHNDDMVAIQSLIATKTIKAPVVTRIQDGDDQRPASETKTRWLPFFGFGASRKKKNNILNSPSLEGGVKVSCKKQEVAPVNKESIYPHHEHHLWKISNKRNRMHNHHHT